MFLNLFFLPKGIVHGLHRAGRQWFEAFDLDSKTKKDLKPIDKNVVISIDPKTGVRVCVYVCVCVCVCIIAYEHCTVV